MDIKGINSVFEKELLENAKNKNKTIVLPEAGMNEEVMLAGIMAAENKIAKMVLLVSDNKLVEKDEKAFFLSLQNKRISTRTVQDLVKKYAHISTPLKKITPHKLRSTFGTNLYRQTGDIYVVADCLGHKDVNTTRKHYAALSDDIRKKAAINLNITNKENN